MELCNRCFFYCMSAMIMITDILVLLLALRMPISALRFNSLRSHRSLRAGILAAR